MTRNVARFLEFLFFASFVAADLLINHVAAVRVMGVACVCTGVAWIWTRSIGVGIEGKEPSFFLRGVWAQITGMLMLILGVTMLFQSSVIACAFGWSSDAVCL